MAPAPAKAWTHSQKNGALPNHALNAETTKDLGGSNGKVLMVKKFLSTIALQTALGLSMVAFQLVAAQDFYKDKTIRFIVGQAAGGGYDAYTRAIARYIGKHIPGNPTAVVENMTGAGSLVAANYLYANAKPDGLTVGNWNSAFVLNQALGDPNVRFDARKFGWIGAPSKGIPVCVIMGFTGLKSIDEILKSAKPIKMGGTAPGSHSVDLPLMLNKMLGTKFNVVTGYAGTAQVRLAIQRREVDGDCTNWESIIATRRDLLDAKGDDKMIPFLIHTRVSDAEARNIPLFTEILKDEVNIATYKAYMSQMEYQRPLTVSPGTPKERLEILRRALKATLADPEFEALASKSRLDITYVSGEDAERLVNEVLSISPKVKDNLQFLVQAK
jgi:tripartite-type tricarboxylate transporter receptor subunit TctC